MQARGSWQPPCTECWPTLWLARRTAAPPGRPCSTQLWTQAPRRYSTRARSWHRTPLRASEPTFLPPAVGQSIVPCTPHAPRREPTPRTLWRARTNPRRDIVAHLFERLRTAGRMEPAAGQLRGVCYPDDAKGCWVVADPSGRQLALSESPVAAADTFVVFDDARCRGADLKVPFPGQQRGWPGLRCGRSIASAWAETRHSQVGRCTQSPHPFPPLALELRSCAPMPWGC